MASVTRLRSGQFALTVHRKTERVSNYLFALRWVSYFRIEDTRSLAVSDSLYKRGYAEPGEYDEIRVA